MNSDLRIQFWAPYRGRVDVYLSSHKGANADFVARRAITDAYAQYDAKWTLPDYDRKLMRCVGLTDGTRTITK
jgi:hypothetical protein